MAASLPYHGREARPPGHGPQANARVSAASRDPGPAHAVRQRAGGRDRAGLRTPLASLPFSPTPRSPAADVGAWAGTGQEARGPARAQREEQSRSLRTSVPRSGAVQARPRRARDRHIDQEHTGTTPPPRVGGGQPAEARKRRRGLLPPESVQSREPHARQAPNTRGTEPPGWVVGESITTQPQAGGESTTQGKRTRTRAHAHVSSSPAALGSPGTVRVRTQIGTSLGARDKSQRTGTRGWRPQGMQERSRASIRPHTLKKPGAVPRTSKRGPRVPQRQAPSDRVSAPLCRYNRTASRERNHRATPRTAGSPHDERVACPHRAQSPQHHTTVTRAPGLPGPSGRPLGGVGRLKWACGKGRGRGRGRGQTVGGARVGG